MRSNLSMTIVSEGNLETVIFCVWLCAKGNLIYDSFNNNKIESIVLLTENGRPTGARRNVVLGYLESFSLQQVLNNCVGTYSYQLAEIVVEFLPTPGPWAF